MTVLMFCDTEFKINLIVRMEEDLFAKYLSGHPENTRDPLVF